MQYLNRKGGCSSIKIEERTGYGRKPLGLEFWLHFHYSNKATVKSQVMILKVYLSEIGNRVIANQGLHNGAREVLRCLSSFL